MKAAFLLWLLTASAALGAPETAPLAEPIAALTAIYRFGAISLSDGSSYYTFSKDGSFRSGPLGMSGREFEGRWTGKDQKFTVTARAGWINGISRNDDYRRIVFSIHGVRVRKPAEMGPLHSNLTFFDGYFLIDELVKIPEPEAPEPK